MKSISKYIYSALAVAALGVTMTACDDWTEPEHIDLDFGTVADSEGYLKYLENLRAYRNKNHKKVYAWFNNVDDAFGTQGLRISSLPDSIDVVVISNPGDVTNQMQEEMFKVRDEKGIQFSYCISFDAIKADWTLKCEELAAKRLAFEKDFPDEEIPAELQDPAFSSFMAQSWTTQLAYFKSVGFDCLMAQFDAKPTNHFTPAELAEYNSQANLFLGILADWHSRNPNVPIDYLGKPQNLTNEGLINDFRQIFLSESLSASNINMFTIALASAGNNIPESKIGLAANMRAIDTNDDPKTGIFSTGALAIEALAEWAAARNVGAVGIVNVQNDYFISNGHYTLVRDFIQTVNPAAK